MHIYTLFPYKNLETTSITTSSARSGVHFRNFTVIAVFPASELLHKRIINRHAPTYRLPSFFIKMLDQLQSQQQTSARSRIHFRYFTVIAGQTLWSTVQQFGYTPYVRACRNPIKCTTGVKCR